MERKGGNLSSMLEVSELGEWTIDLSPVGMYVLPPKNHFK